MGKPDFNSCKRFKIEDPWGWYFISARNGLKYFWKAAYDGLSLQGNQFSYLTLVDDILPEVEKKHPEVRFMPFFMKEWFYDQIEYRYWKEFYTGVTSKNFNRDKKLGYIAFGAGTIEKNDESYIIRDVLPFEMEMQLKSVKKKDDLETGFKYKFSAMYMCHTKTRIRKHEILEIEDYDPDDLILYIKISNTEPVPIETF